MDHSEGSKPQMIIPQSPMMKLARRLGMEKVAWSLRRLYCPVSEEALVLEVGSGGNPYFRANVLVDAYEQTSERHWVPLISDRPTVLAFTEKLPFKDKAFDFVIASHVLEHSHDPAAFLAEIQRVAKAGYIEVPDAFMERINPYPDHRLEITVRKDKLKIRKKSAWEEDADLVELYEDRAKTIVTSEVIPGHPFDFHVRYYWQNNIEFEIINPETGSMLEKPATQHAVAVPQPTLKGRVQGKILAVVRRLFSQHRRNAGIDLISLLRCNHCLQNSELRKENDELCCHSCGRKFPLRDGIPDMTDSA